LKKLVTGCKKEFKLNIPLSLVALFVSKIANGIIKMADIQEPNIEDIELSSARFLPKVFAKKYNTYTAIAKIIGKPNPPFLIIEPKGAPIKKRITQDKEKATLL
jgi:hypothetical protein